MNPNTPEHGSEGTHTACNARIQAEGGKARCCYCVPHDGCEFGQVADTTELSMATDRLQQSLGRALGHADEAVDAMRSAKDISEELAYVTQPTAPPLAAPLAAPDALEQMLDHIANVYYQIGLNYAAKGWNRPKVGIGRAYIAQVARLTQEARIDEVTQAVAAFDGLDVSSDPAYNGTKHLRARLAELNVKGDKQ